MKRGMPDESLGFIHKDGGGFYPWHRDSKYHGFSSFWGSDGSNLIEHAIPVATVAELVVEVFRAGAAFGCSITAIGADCTDMAMTPSSAGALQRRLHPWRCVLGRP